VFRLAVHSPVKIRTTAQWTRDQDHLVSSRENMADDWPLIGTLVGIWPGSGRDRPAGTDDWPMNGRADARIEDLAVEKSNGPKSGQTIRKREDLVHKTANLADS